MITTLAAAARRIRDRARQRRDYEALLSLDEHLLRDMGVRRGDVLARLGRRADA